MHLPIRYPEDPTDPVGSTRLEKAHEWVARAARPPAADRSAIYAEVCNLLEDFQGFFRRHGEPFIRRFHAEGFKICVLGDIALAATIGYLRDVLPWGEAGFGRINDVEFQDWLLSHGANPEYVWTAPVRCLYDLGFAYQDGDSSSSTNAKAAAGVALRILLSTVAAYKDAPLWKMNAGMGDTIFTPLYEVLRARGVEFNFFHRVMNLGLSPDGQWINRVELSRQVNLAKQEYHPLIPVKGLLCWPSEPLWDQIAGGKPASGAAWDLESAWCTYSVGQRTLKLGADFHILVLAIPPAALADIGKELLARCAPIAKMHEAMSWTPTRSAQLWLQPDLLGLGWQAGTTVATAYSDPYRSWGEMSHLLVREVWKDKPPGSCEYFCGVLTAPARLPPYGDRQFISEQTARVQRDFIEWANGSIGHLFPNAVGPDGKGLNQALVVSQFYRANLDPSELYVQSFPGSISSRLKADGTGIANLYLAGDWTATRLNAGCVEAAVESGKNAAEAICGQRL